MESRFKAKHSGGSNGDGAELTPQMRQEMIINRIEEVIGNALMGRARMLSELTDPRRDIYDECGFPKGDIPPQMYKDLFDRDAIAARVVEVLPEETWQTTPTVYESETTDDVTQFEECWDNLSRSLRKDSHYQDEEGSPIWDYLCRADKISGIGQYGVILLGLDDGLPLNMPVRTWEDRKPDNTYPGATGGYSFPGGDKLPGIDSVNPSTQGTDAQYQGQFSPLAVPTASSPSGVPKNLPSDTTKAGTRTQLEDKAKAGPGAKDDNVLPDFPGDETDESAQTDGQGDKRVPGDDEEGDGASSDSEAGLSQDDIDLIVRAIGGEQLTTGEDGSLIGEDGRPVGADKPPPFDPRVNLNYIRVFPQSQAQVTQYERDVNSPRFGQPVMYLITFNDPREQHSGTGLPVASQNVHWTRIIHVAETGSSSSEVFAIERMKPVLNNLLSLQKLYGGSAEMYWKGAFPGISLETHPQLGGDVKVDASATRDMMEDYSNGLQRFLLLMGMSAKPLSPQVVDPSPQVNVQIEAICIKLGIPVRVFKGSERGELASSQDDSAWNDRLKKRQAVYVTPKIIVPFVDRLINIGVLPQPSGFSVAWKDLDSLSETEKATNANTITTAIGAYISGQCESLITPKDWMVHVLQFTDDQAEQIIEASKQHVDEQNQEQQALADEHGFIPAPPDGFHHDPADLPEGIAPDGSPLPPAPVIAPHAPGGPPVPPNAGGPPKQGSPPPPGGKAPAAPGKPGAPASPPPGKGIQPGPYGSKLPKQPKPVTNAILEMLVSMNQRIDSLVLRNEWDPNQPRDAQGRFGSGGGYGGGAGTKSAPVASFPHALPADAPPMAIPVHIPQAIPVNSPSTGANPGVHPSGSDSAGSKSAVSGHADSPSSGGDSAKAAGLKQKAIDLFTKSKAKVTGAGQAIYQKLPKPLQKVVDVGQAIEHGLEGAYHAGQKLAKEVAAQRGGDEKHVERLGKWLSLADGFSRWTANIPVVHEALHVVAHIGGPVGFIGAKAGYYVPVASLGYIGYSMAHEAVSKRSVSSPFSMINKARKSMQAKAKVEKDAGHGH